MVVPTSRPETLAKKQTTIARKQPEKQTEQPDLPAFDYFSQKLVTGSDTCSVFCGESTDCLLIALLCVPFTKNCM